MRLPSNQPPGTGCCGKRSLRLTPTSAPAPADAGPAHQACGRRPPASQPPIRPRAVGARTETSSTACADGRPVLPGPLQGKTLAAERDIAYVRLAVILFNVAVYWPLLRH